MKKGSHILQFWKRRLICVFFLGLYLPFSFRETINSVGKFLKSFFFKYLFFVFVLILDCYLVGYIHQNSLNFFFYFFLLFYNILLFYVMGIVPSDRASVSRVLLSLVDEYVPIPKGLIFKETFNFSITENNAFIAECWSLLRFRQPNVLFISALLRKDNKDSPERVPLFMISSVYFSRAQNTYLSSNLDDKSAREGLDTFLSEITPYFPLHTVFISNHVPTNTRFAGVKDEDISIDFYMNGNSRKLINRSCYDFSVHLFIDSYGLSDVNREYAPLYLFTFEEIFPNDIKCGNVDSLVIPFTLDFTPLGLLKFRGIPTPFSVELRFPSLVGIIVDVERWDF